MPKRASTPASSPEAMAMGKWFITRSNQPVAPLMVINTAQSMNEPTASGMENPPLMPAVARTAAPGVLQATMTGLRSSSEGTAVHSPMPSPRAHIQELICAGLAPNARAAWNTMATELVNPTSTATNPAVKAAGDRSLKNCMTPILSACRGDGCRDGSDLDFGAQFHHGVTGQFQEVGGTAGIQVHLCKQLFTPLRHAATQRR